MKKTYSQVHDRLRRAGLRTTRQRLALGKLLFDGGGRHVTAEILHAEALAIGVRVSLATVYNTLHQFTAAGLMREIMVDSQRAYFDTNTRDHHHFFIEDSGSLIDIPGHQVALSRLPEPPPGTVLKSVDLVIRVAEVSPKK
ncbi:MAG: transcriptional repressor [Proteobacteria bacterium]|nr:transcriptional repressor [Pseudomonadota bacterium]